MSNKKEDLFGLNNYSENEDVSMGEEEQEDTRFTKSRKQAFSDSDDSDEEDDVINTTQEKTTTTEETETQNEDNQAEDSDSDDPLQGEGLDVPISAKGRRKAKKLKKLTPEELKKFEEVRKKTGVCYLSRIPPFMQPKAVRSLLQKHAEVGRIFLVPEDAKIAARRKKYGNEKRTNFKEGWVEFRNKHTAKALAEHLNMKEIGGKRSSPYYSEMWNIKYLPKFKWNHLSEHMAQEKQARKQRLRNEIAQSNRENKTYIQNVERAKMLQNMEQKKRKREGAADTNSTEPRKEKIQRTFEQRGKVNRQADPTKSGKLYMDKLDAPLKSVLSSVFAKK